MIDSILDVAGQKGTGIETILAALNLGVSVSIIGTAVAIRLMSKRRGEREQIHDVMKPKRFPLKVASRPKFIEMLGEALHAATLLIFSQGFRQLQAASAEYGWKLPLAEIAQLWTGGCVIRCACLKDIAAAYLREPDLTHLMVADGIREEILRCEDSLAEVIAAAARARIPKLTLSAAHEYLLLMQDTDLPVNLVAAQRDGFGNHGFFRADRMGSGLYHLSLDD